MTRRASRLRRGGVVATCRPQRLTGRILLSEPDGGRARSRCGRRLDTRGGVNRRAEISGNQQIGEAGDSLLGFLVLSFVVENSYKAGEGTNYPSKRGQGRNDDRLPPPRCDLSPSGLLLVNQTTHH